MARRTVWFAIGLATCVCSWAACSAPPAQDSSAERLSRRLERTIERHTGASLAALALPTADDFANIPQDPRNRLTREKVALGRALFHEVGLSIATLDEKNRGTVSCASCHRAGAGFQAGQAQGIGEGASSVGFIGPRRKSTDATQVAPDVQGIRTPSVLNVAYQFTLHWNGELGASGTNAGTEPQWTAGTAKAVNHLGYQAVESQAIAGLKIHRMAVDARVVDELGYRGAFDRVFGDLAERDRYTANAAGLAIAAYERTLLPTKAPFQRWLRGDVYAMLPDELRGAVLFFGEAGCVTCHSGPALSNGNFHVAGMPDLYASEEPVVGTSADMAVNLGRASFTHRTSDAYAFKTPQLYNLADSPYYGHGSSHKTLTEFVGAHLSGRSGNPRVLDEQLDETLRSRRLSDGEVADLVSFLREGLRDPDLRRYVPRSAQGRKPEGLALRR